MFFAVLATSTAFAASTNTGSVTMFCQWDGTGARPPQVALDVTVSGTSIYTPFCPPGLESFGYGSGSVGAYGSGQVGGAGVSMSFQGVQNLPNSWFFQGTDEESLMPSGGTGSGIIEFTLTHDWLGYADFLSSARTDAHFLFNGQEVWGGFDPVCFIPDNGARCFQPHSTVIVIDEPITYGTPFTFGGIVTGHGAGSVGFASGSSSLSFSATLLSDGELVSVPEPSAFGTAGFGLLLTAIRIIKTKRRTLVS